MGTTLSSNDVVNGGTGADTLTATINTAATSNPTITGVETATLTYAAAGTLNLSKTEGLATVNLTPNADASLSNASAVLTTVNIASATGTPDVNVGYRTGAAGDLTFNIGGTADIFLDDMALTRVETLNFNFTGTQTNDIDDVTVTGAPTTAISVAVAANNDASIDAIYASGITSFDMTVAENADAYVYAYASGNVGDVSVDTAASTSAYAYVEATSGGVGNIAVTAKGFSASADVDVYANSGGAGSGGVGDISVSASGGGASAYAYVIASDGDVGSVTVNALNNSDGDASAYVSAIYTLDADGEVVGGNVGDVSLDIVGQKASGNIDVYANGGDITSLTISVNGASGSGTIDASTYAVLNSAGDAVGGNIGAISVSAIGASAEADTYAYAYGLISAGEYKGGGEIGDIDLYVAGASAESDVYAYGYSGGSVGNIDIVVDSTGAYSASGDVDAYVYGAGGQVATIGDVTMTVINPTDSSAGVYLYASAGGNIGNITADVQGGTSGHISIGANAYVNGDGSGGDIGNITLTDTSMGGDHYINLFAQGTIGDVTASIGGGNADVFMSIDDAEAAGDVTLTIASTQNDDAGSLYIGDNFNVGDVGVVTLKGGSVNSTFDIYGGSGWSVDSVAAVDASLFEGSAYIDLSEVVSGTEIYASKNQSYIIGTAESDQIYLGAKSDTVEFTGSTPTDYIFNFKTGTTDGDVLDLLATAGTLRAVLSADPAATQLDANDIVRLVDIAGGEDITTAAGLLDALNTGEYSNITSDASEAYTFVTALDSTSTTLHVFHATADADDDGVFDAVTLVGVVESTGALSTLVTGNFA